MQKLRMFSIPVRSSNFSKPQKYELKVRRDLRVVVFYFGGFLIIVRIKAFKIRSMKQTLLSVILILLPSLAALAQNSLTGRVIDSLTQEPLAFVSIYFANTTLGTTTDTEGKFSLRNIPAGKYDLTVSFVGYYSTQVSLAFDQNTTHTVNVALTEKATQLNEVVVSPDNSNRQFNLQTFRQGFLGTTRNARSARIVNEDDLDFDFDAQTRVFTAFSRNPIIVENKALGYRLIYDLYDFKIDYTNNAQAFFGIPRFENLADKTKGRWDRERKRAYLGSFSHFVRLLRSGSFEEHFDVFEFFRNPNPERPSEEILKQKIKYWGERQLTSGNLIVKPGSAFTDSLSYYISLRKLPELVDSIGRKMDATLLTNADRTKITYTGMLYMIYKNEREEEGYTISRQGPQAQQYSVVHFFAPVSIYDNGYYGDVRDVFFEGYLGWAEKIADTLPLEYTLPVLEEK
jgi:hypothetical protein